MQPTRQSTTGTRANQQAQPSKSCSHAAVEDGAAKARHEILHEAKVVLRAEQRSERLLGLEEVVEVGARVGQVWRDRLVVIGPLAVADVDGLWQT